MMALLRSLRKLFANDGILSAAISLSVSTIGAGVLVYPSLCQNSGILVVLLLVALFGTLTVWSIDYLIVASEAMKLLSYEELSRELLGPTFETIIRWVLIIYSLGICAAYIVITGEIFYPMLPILRIYLPFLSTSAHVTYFIFFVFMLPLSCTPYITHVHCVSYIAMCSTLAVCGMIVHRYFFPLSPHNVNHGDIYLIRHSKQALFAVPVIMYSFDCQALTFQLYSNIKNRSRQRMFLASTLSVIMTSSVMVCVGIFGYLSYGSNTRGNILFNYNTLKDHAFGAAQCVYSVTIIIAFVLVIFFCRDAIFILLCGYNSTTHELAHKAISHTYNLAVTLGILFTVLFIALNVKGFVFLVGIMGSACSSTVCFTYPALFRLALHFRAMEPCTRRELVCAIVMFVTGLLGLVVGTAFAVVGSVED